MSSDILAFHIMSSDFLKFSFGFLGCSRISYRFLTLVYRLLEAISWNSFFFKVS